MQEIRVERHTPLLRNLTVWEIPFANATVLDGALGGPSSLQKLRTEYRETFGTQMISGGHHGTLQLTNVGLLSCLAVARRWNKKAANTLLEAFASAGIEELINSDEYKAARDQTIEAIRAHWATIAAETAGMGMPMAGLIVAVVSSLMAGSEQVRHVVQRVREISQQVDVALGSSYRRFPGQFVRTEGRRALIVVDTGEREELRTVDADYLAHNGITAPGATFILNELQFSPDNCASVYVPALTDEPSASLEAKLVAAESPLPSPHD